ncbi:MAG: hypothetical protein H0V34_14075 [Gammaproteobacteria bacterium]|nr:hypothetical protein [Gammaproteobacteria bacterium]
MSQTISIGRVMLVAGGMVLHSAASAAPATEDDVDAFDRQARVVDRSLQLAQAEEVGLAEDPSSVEEFYELDQKVRILERQLDIQEEEEADALEEDTTASADESGFVIESGDGAFTLKLKVLVQGDTRVYADDEDTASDTSWCAARAQPWRAPSASLFHSS